MMPVSLHQAEIARQAISAREKARQGDSEGLGPVGEAEAGTEGAVAGDEGATGLGEERFLDYAGRPFAGAEGKKNHRPASLGMTVGR
jgi:hypothetical protein